MIINDAKNNPPEKYFVNDGKLAISANHVNGQITEFKAEYKGKKMRSQVENSDVLAAWKRIEKFLAGIK